MVFIRLPELCYFQTANTFELYNTNGSLSQYIIYNLFRILRPIRKKFNLTINEIVILNGMMLYNKYVGSSFSYSAIIRYIGYSNDKKMKYYFGSLQDINLLHIKSDIITRHLLSSQNKSAETTETKVIMSVISLLSSSQGQKGNEANISLAKEISASNDKGAVRELVDNLSNKNKNIQSDCIKTLYEIGYLKPELIADYHGEFIKLLTSKNNRLVWGGMIALSKITDLKHAEIFASLNTIMDTVNRGSVITIDAGVEILSRLNKYANYFNVTEPLLMEQLWKCAIKQLPMYIEKSIASIRKGNKEIYLTLIERRKKECDNDSQTKRLDKSLKQIKNI